MADYTLIISHTIFFFLKLTDFYNAKDPLNDDSGEIQNIIRLLECVIFVVFLIKWMHMIEIYRDYGLLTVLIADSIYKVIPFMVLFILWTALFAIQYFILKSNQKDAEAYLGVESVLGFMFVAFENGIGNIIPPTVDSWTGEENKSITATLIIYIVYLVWIMNQYILLVVLLNFVIALISEVYERVMDQRMIHEYK